MRAKIENPKFFSDVIAIISDLVSEVKLKFNDEGMGIVAVDPATVALVSFKLPKAVFSEYEAGNEVLGVNLDNFSVWATVRFWTSTVCYKIALDKNRIRNIAEYLLQLIT